MPKIMTPEEVLNSVVEGINTGDLNSLMTLYETDACFASQPGQFAKSPDSIRQSLRSFIDLKGIPANHIVLVVYSFSANQPRHNKTNSQY